MLHGWTVLNNVTVGWWGGKHLGFTTDAKTKSLPSKDGDDDPIQNRFFMLKAFHILVTHESERFETSPN